MAPDAPPWRVTFVGRRRLLADFDFLAPGHGPWRLLAEGGARAVGALSAAAGHGAATFELHISLVERWWGLPGDLKTDAARLPPAARAALARLGLDPGARPLLHAYATHLDTFLAVAPSRVEQQARLVAPELAARWRELTGASYEPTDSQADLKFFWEQMVVGRDRRRFGDTGADVPFDTFARVLREGGVLVKVIAEGPRPAWVSGVLLTGAAPGADLAVFRPGIADADALDDARLAELVCHHDIAALEVARARGAKVLGLGLTRALAHNPIYRHKHGLGATFRAAARGPRFAISASPEARRLLARHAPLVVP